MSDIVLSASVRQNLLSLQSTADLLATTQNRLATGRKVNSALDNPTNYFTALSLDSRAADINNLLDGIGNGVQVLQAANTGITSLQKLVDSAKSVANQALQTLVGYSTKSTIETAPISGASAADLRGVASAFTDATSVGAAATGANISAYTNAVFTGGNVLNDDTGGAAAITGATILAGAAGAGSDNLATNLLAADTLTVNGIAINFNSGGGTTGTATAGTLDIDVTTGTVSDILAAIDAITGTAVASTVNGTGGLDLSTGTTADLVITGSANALTALGFGAGVNQARGGGVAGTPALTGTTLLGGTVTAGGPDILATPFKAGNTLTINSQVLTFVASGATGPNQINVGDDVTTLLAKIDALSGATAPSTIAGGVITLHTGTTSDLTITSSNAAAFNSLGFTGGGVTQARGGGVSALNGLTLTIGATGGGAPTNITFGNGTGGTVRSLNDLNVQLAANHLFATFDSTTTRITITATNEAAASTIGAIGGTAAGVGAPFNGIIAPAPVADSIAQETRAGLVNQYNNILAQIATTAQDASYNGINLLNGDQLKLTFNETGKSTLTIQGVVFDPAGLGLSLLSVGVDFLDNGSANRTIDLLNTAGATLRSQASTLGSNLSIVQIRQDFSKNLINVLQTGSSNLTLADTNEEAANSQALATRQSIAVSALALANQSQQSVLQLLR